MGLIISQPVNQVICILLFANYILLSGFNKNDYYYNLLLLLKKIGNARPGEGD